MWAFPKVLKSLSCRGWQSVPTSTILLTKAWIPVQLPGQHVAFCPRTEEVQHHDDTHLPASNPVTAVSPPAGSAARGKHPTMLLHCNPVTAVSPPVGSAARGKHPTTLLHCVLTTVSDNMSDRRFLILLHPSSWMEWLSAAHTSHKVPYNTSPDTCFCFLMRGKWKT